MSYELSLVDSIESLWRLRTDSQSVRVCSVCSVHYQWMTRVTVCVCVCVWVQQSHAGSQGRDTWCSLWELPSETHTTATCSLTERTQVSQNRNVFSLSLSHSGGGIGSLSVLSLWLGGLIHLQSHITWWALLADELRWSGFKSRSGRESSVGWTNGSCAITLISVSSLNCDTDRCRLWSYDITAR